MATDNQLHQLFGALQAELSAALDSSRVALHNAEAKGDAAEQLWLALLKCHLPHRYQVDKGFVVDSNGAVSHFIDMIIYDRQYTPCIFNKGTNLYVPAESVYGILEVKQDLSKEHIEYAGEKAESVRKLFRTNAPVKWLKGTSENKPLPPVLAGIVANKSSWSPPFGDAFKAAMESQAGDCRLDLGIGVVDGSFETFNGADGFTIEVSKPEVALAAFLLTLFGRLQDLGTVPAIDYKKYALALK